MFRGFTKLIGLFTVNGINLNKDEMVVISDRGQAIDNAVESSLPKAYHNKYCIKHLEINIKSDFRGSSVIKLLLYEAYDAVTKIEFNTILEKMVKNDPLIYEYVHNIHGWSLHEAIENNCVLWGMKTNNIVEVTFSWLQDARNLTPYYFVISVITKIFELNYSFIDEMIKLNSNKLITPYALEVFERNGFKANEGGGYIVTAQFAAYVKHARDSSKLNFYGGIISLKDKLAAL